MKRLFVIALLAAGCEKDLLANLDASIDAPGTPDAATICKAPTTDAHPAAAYTVYLNFDGVTLTKADDDARVDHAQVLINAMSVIPRYMPNDTDTVRQGRIDLIVGYVTHALAPYSIDVVTTRPASGDYEMAVIGGDPVTLGYQQGLVSIAPGTCDANNRNRVSIEFDVGLNAVQETYSVLSDLGAMVGLTGTTRACDCMNRGGGDPCPTENSQVCTFADMAPIGANSNPCGRGMYQDELMLLREVWGCR
jgi:hypothetical protein